MQTGVFFVGSPRLNKKQDEVQQKKTIFGVLFVLYSVP